MITGGGPVIPLRNGLRYESLPFASTALGRGQDNTGRKQAKAAQNEGGEGHSSCSVANTPDQRTTERTGQVADRVSPGDSRRGGSARQNSHGQSPTGRGYT
jgi:hypothetical protein